MNEEQKRYGKAFATSIAIHIALCLVMAALGFTFTQKDPQILEVTLAGGPPPKLGSPKAVKTVHPKEKKQVIIPKKDDIVEKKKDVPRQPQPEQTESAPETPGVAHGVEDGKEEGTGTAPNATGNGSGEGDKHGVPATPPRVLSSYKPPYPYDARSRNIVGTTYVKVLVNASGKVEESFVASSSGNIQLDDAAIKALYKWRFSPAKDGFNQPCPCYIIIPIRFSLK